MQYIMVILICFGANCQAIWEKTYYTSKEECLSATLPVKQYMMEVYPQSSGEIYCMTEEQFEAYNKQLLEGDKPTAPADPT